MKIAGEKDKERILQYLQKNLQDCVYLYIDIMNYGTCTDNIRVWFQEEADEICLVVMKYYDSFQIYSREKLFDAEAVKALVDDYPVSMISGRKDMIEKIAGLCPEYEDTYGVVFLMDQYRAMQSPIEICEATEQETSEIAELICSDSEIGGHYTPENLANQLAERIRTCTGRSYIIRDNGKIIAHSATYAEAEGIAVVGGTIIAPEYRNGNYYMLLSNFMLQQLATEGKRAYTFSLSRKMIHYHERLHTRCGEYGKLVKSNHNKRRKEMREKVLDVLCGVNAEIRKNEDKDLLAAGLIDSFEIVNLVVELEEAFDIEIDPELVVPENFQTVDKIVALIDRIIG